VVSIQGLNEGTNVSRHRLWVAYILGSLTVGGATAFDVNDLIYWQK